MKLLRTILFFIHLAVLLAIFGTYLNSVVPPKVFPYFNFLSLSFPVLAIVHGLLCVYWIFSLKKRALFFVALSFLMIPLLKPWINYSSSKQKDKTLKTVTFNVRNGYNDNKKDIREFLDKSDADFIFAQEAGGLTAENSELKFISKGFPVTMIYSRHKIIEKGAVLSKQGVGEAQYADVEIDGRRIRLVNMYLEPYFLSKSMVKPTQNYAVNEDKARDLVRRMAPTFKTHQDQIKKVVDFIKTSPYPVILGGDFNAVPNSYEYFQIRNLLNDAFLQSGKGISTSFHDYKFPIRIDYIFSSKEFEAVFYHVDRNTGFSDHFPVVAELKFVE